MQYAAVRIRISFLAYMSGLSWPQDKILSRYCISWPTVQNKTFTNIAKFISAATKLRGESAGFWYVKYQTTVSVNLNIVSFCMYYFVFVCSVCICIVYARIE